MGKLVNVLHRLGFDEVVILLMVPDLTVIEESEELLRTTRIRKISRIYILLSGMGKIL